MNPFPSSMSHRAPRLLLLLVLAFSLQFPALLTAAPLFESMLLFPGAKNDRPNYRIPSLTRAKNGDLLAIVEKRNSGIGDVGDTDIVIRRSTDNGLTWGAIETIFDDGISTCTDITTVVTDAGPASSRIFLFFLKNKKKFAYVYSDDHGATWMTAGANPNSGYEGLPMPFIIHDQVTVNNHAEKTGWDYLNGAASNNAADQPAVSGSQAAEWERDWTQRYGIGPGNAAIQLRHGAHAGRILVSARHRERIGGSIQTWAHVFYSDDRGASWQLGPQRILQNGSESQLVELPDGTIYLNLRNETAADRDNDATFRYVAVSTDGGATWGAPANAPGHKDTQLVSTVCHAAVELYENPANASDASNGTVLFANPLSNHREEDHPYGRYRMSMRRSTATAPGGVVTWSDAKVIYPHPSSYADIAILANGEIGLIYERGDPGTTSYWSELHFARFNLEWLDSPAARPATVPVRLANLFSEGMVLQRSKDVPIWGYASAGDTITVNFAGQTQTAIADADGHWVAVLDPMPASATPRDMTVSGPGANNIVRVGNILVGDVWIASGQSNMNWDLNMIAREYPDEAAAIRLDIATATHLVRQFEAVGITGSGADTFGRNEPADNVTGVWTWSSSSTLTTGNFSATAYHFACKILERTGVPVGIINASVGGTVIEAWTDPQTLEDPGLAFAKEPWPGKGTRDTASNLYNALVAPLTPVALKGFVWYQGEHNASRAGSYAAIFTPFINGWRARFNAPDAPFYFVQLPNFATSDDWAGLRAAQATALALPATGMAVTIDIGNDNNIHPPNKREAGHRLARLARFHDYGETTLEYSGPEPVGVTLDGSCVMLDFAHAAGLMLDVSKQRPGIPAFEVSADGVAYYAATATVNGISIAVSASQVSAPRHIRYAWHNTPSTPLYNSAGLPAAPLYISLEHLPNSPAAPGDIEAYAGRSATLTASATGATSYHWQVSSDGGATWTDISALANPALHYSGYNSATLVIGNITFAMNGCAYRYIAGNAHGGVASAPATLAVEEPLLPEPAGIVLDNDGAIFLTDATRGSVHKIVSGTLFAFSGSTAFNKPAGIKINPVSGLLQFAESGANTIRTCTASAQFGVLTGAAAAGLREPSGLAIDENGNTYIADTGNNAIRMISPAGAVATLAGSTAGASGTANGAGNSARFNAPRGIAVSADATGSSGHAYVADTGNHTIRAIDLATRQVTTLAGVAGVAGHSDTGAGHFDSPKGLVVDRNGILYVADSGNSVIRELPGIGVGAGTLRTIAGLPGVPGLADGTGTAARFRNPSDLALGPDGRLYVADTDNMAIREILLDDTVRTLALVSGTGSGAVPVTPPPDPPPRSSGGGGGGGALSICFLFALGMMGVVRRLASKTTRCASNRNRFG